MITDSNAYLGNWPYWRVDVANGDQLAAHLKENGVDRGVVSSLRSVFFDAEEGNQEVVDACRKHPEVLSGVATLTPLSRRDGPGYQGLSNGTLRGIRLYPAHHFFSLQDAGRVVEFAESAKVPIAIPYRLMMNWQVPSPPFGEVVSLIRANPNVDFVLCSLNYEVLAFVSMIERPSNLYIETSGLQQELGMSIVVESLGQDRLILGTATPVQYARPGIEKVLQSSLPDQTKERVLHETAERLYRLK